ncbi:MAG: cupin domain-containing protein [Gaiellaceae bacterium]
MTEPVNVFDVETRYREDRPEQFRRGGLPLAPLIGGKLLGASVYELPPAQSICPYHYEYGNEEWLIVLAGRPTLRTPEGERELVPGEITCFPEGPAGAHKVTNRGQEAVRVLMVSTKDAPAVWVYPDSDKIALWTGNAADGLMARRSSHVDYWDGEV